MEISGDLADLYQVGLQMLPEMGNCFAEAANILDSTHSHEEFRSVRYDENPNPAIHGTIEIASPAFDSWLELRNEIQSVLKINADNLQQGGAALVLAADAYAREDGYTSDEIDKVKNDIDSPDLVEPK